MDTITITDLNIGRKAYGLAGQYMYVVIVTYSTGEAHFVTFTGNHYGGPIVINNDVVVDQSVRDRIGDTLDTDWIKRFYEQA